MFVKLSSRIKHEVSSLEEASKACRRFISDNYLGSRDWDGGKVYEGKKVVAVVSYNGRVWTPDRKREISF